MRSHIKFIILFMVSIGGMDIASASGGLPFNRLIYVNEWGGTFDTTANIDKVISDAVYMKADAIAIQVGSEYFEAARDPGKISWDSRAKPTYNGLPMLEYFINRAHANNIKVHAWSAVSIVSGAFRAEYNLFGPSVNFPYNIVTQSGNKITSDTYYRLDISFQGLQDYEIGLYTWVAKNYPTLDGLHIEEPVLLDYSYSTAVREKVKIKYGYDPLYPGGKIQLQVQKDITDIQRDSWNTFFTNLRRSINANKANPNFQLSANSWIMRYNSGPIAGLDPQYLARNHLLDWYSLQIASAPTIDFKKKVRALSTAITEIPVVATIYPYYHSPIGDLPNPAFFDRAATACNYGADGLGIFTWNRLEGTINGQNIITTLRSIPTSSCGTSTGPVSTPTANPTPVPEPVIIPTVNTPTLSSPSGTYSSVMSISISTSTPGATIHYTIDGTTPTESSPTYSDSVKISSTTTLKARAWKTGSTPSAIAAATYTISIAPPVPAPVIIPIVNPPTLSSPSGTYSSVMSISISTSTPGATIHYTIDGTTPTESSPTYSDSVIISSTATLKARAWKTGSTPSAITAATYTISIAPVIIPTIPATASEPAMINNSDFESGSNSWTFYTGGSGIFSMDSPGYKGNNSAKLALDSRSENIQLYQTDVTLESNTLYRLSFAAYSTTGRNLTVNLIKHDIPYTNYGLIFAPNLGTDWQTFTTEFTTTGFTGTVDDGRLMFFIGELANAGDIYYIDDVRLEKVTPPTVIGNSPTGTNVSVEAWITVNFSEAMNQSSVESSLFTIPETTGEFSWSGNNVTYIPVNLSYDTVYDVIIETDAKDLSGDNMLSAYNWEFNTDSPPGNILSNPGFESGSTSWEFYTGESGTFSMSSPGYVGENTAKLVLNTPSSNIQLYHAGITLEPNTFYRLSFAAYSKTGNDLIVNLVQHDSPYAYYGLDFNPNLGTTWQTFTTEFKTRGFSGTVNDGRLLFQVGPFADAGDFYYIDDVRLEMINDSNMI